MKDVKQLNTKLHDNALKLIPEQSNFEPQNVQLAVLGPNDSLCIGYDRTVCKMSNSNKL